VFRKQRVIRDPEREAKSYRKTSEIERTRTVIMFGRKKLRPGVASQFFTSNHNYKKP